MNKEANVRNPSGSNRAKTHWKMRDAKERGDTNHDQTSEQKIAYRSAVRQALWANQLHNAVLAFTEAL